MTEVYTVPLFKYCTAIVLSDLNASSMLATEKEKCYGTHAPQLLNAIDNTLKYLAQAMQKERKKNHPKEYKRLSEYQ